jgi:hypothetical protein
MTPQPDSEPLADPRIASAVTELQALIRARYPDAIFAVAPGEDPAGTYVTAIVDVPDVDDVFEVVVRRLLELQVEEGLPVYLIPVRPIARVVADLRDHVPPRLPALLPSR